jgi:hypothetical protein
LKRNRINRRGVESNHTSALWISTSGRRRNHARSRGLDDYNAKLFLQGGKMMWGEVVMGHLRRPAIIAAFLIVTISIPPPMFSQTAPRQRQSRRSSRADALAPAVYELLGLYPITPQSPDEKDSENADVQSKEESKPPADDAPIKELIHYWSKNRDANTSKPSDKVRQRLLEACEDNPELAIAFVDLLPETTDTHDRLYKLLQEGEGEIFWKRFLRNWLQLNSRYFRDELIAEARMEDNLGSLPGNKLKLLAHSDWESARPIVEALASTGNPQMAAIAFSLLYEQALRDGDSAQVEKYRALLKAIVINVRTPQYGRQVALSSLADAEWNGQEDWVVSLFADPAMSGLQNNAGASVSKAAAENISEEAAPNILGALLGTHSERWWPVIINLVGHQNPTVRLSAVKTLSQSMGAVEIDKKTEIAGKLAPWLTDPNWAATDGRSEFIRALSATQAPELIPGLIWILDYDENPENRADAASALVQYRDPRATPAMRRALEKEEKESRRDAIAAALAECGGFSDDEMAEAIEAYAQMVVTEAGQQEIAQAAYDDSKKPLPLKISVGRLLSEGDEAGEGVEIRGKAIQATEGLALRLIERAKSLRSSQPDVARRMLRVVEGASLRVAEINLVERIGAGWIDIEALKLALEKRESLRKSGVDELYKLVKDGGYAAGVAASILNDEREQRETLAGADAKAQLALLAGARYMRDKLPVELVGKLLNSPNRALAKASESYLEVEDSAEARKLVLARHRGEAYILGDGAGIDHSSLQDWEETIRREIKSRNDLEAIYAAGRVWVSQIDGIVIRVRGGKAEISLYDVEGRRDLRALSQSEFEELKSFTSRQEVEDLGPQSYACPSDRGCYEYMRLTKNGGRRIMFFNLRRAPKNPTLHEELSGLFYRLSRSGDFIARYDIEDKIPGVEVLLADKKQEAMMVCGEGSEIRILIGEKGAEYKQDLSEAMPEWREFTSGKLGKTADAPATCRLSSSISSSIKARPDNQFRWIHWPTRSGDAWVFGSYRGDSGIWKFEPGAEPAKIISGSYSNPVVTPDGKWMVAIKTENEPPQLVRHNLQTGQEFPVTLPNDANRAPVAYVAAHAKVFLGYYAGNGQPNPSAVHYLLDPETGTVQEVKGEFAPLRDGFIRELQPTGNPNEFWTALPDFDRKATLIGRYDSMNFVFSQVLELPGLILRENNFWVDAAAGKIWFTYEGHLLRIPLPPTPKSSRYRER